MCTRPFSTLTEQVKILESRGLIISDGEKAQYILSRENYYNVINGYKKPFLKKDLDGNVSVPERYSEGCTFDEIYGLYNFDRDLRMILLGALLKFETHFKTSCAYHFSDKFRGPYAYLAIENYSKEKDMLSNVLNNIATLSNEINKNTKRNQSKTVYISHYIENHDCVPLWVLVNTLTIGNMSYFYSAIDGSVKDRIAKDFSEQFKSDYKSIEKVGSEELEQVVKAVNLFRNVCAHEEVLFLFKLIKGVKYSIFTKFYRNSTIDEAAIRESNLYSLICILKIVLSKTDYMYLINSLDNLFNRYKVEFKSVRFGDIIRLSGFKETWKEDLN